MKHNIHTAGKKGLGIRLWSLIINSLLLPTLLKK